MRTKVSGNYVCPSCNFGRLYTCLKLPGPCQCTTHQAPAEHVTRHRPTFCCGLQRQLLLQPHDAGTPCRPCTNTFCRYEKAEAEQQLEKLEEDNRLKEQKKEQQKVMNEGKDPMEELEDTYNTKD